MKSNHYKIVDPSWQPPTTSPIKYPFELDLFQKQAFHLIETSHSVFVTAHTSSGKTLVAEHAITLAAESGKKAIYTSPIKALSNQKYFDFKQKFEDVGILTGDVQMNSSAQCLIMTTEILRNQLFRGTLDDSVGVVIFDEVHFINDHERGVVWEESLIMLPEHVVLILLSATVSNSIEFAEWVGRVKNRTIFIIATTQRPVPLEFLIFSDDKIFDTNGDFLPSRNIEEQKKRYYATKNSNQKDYLNYFKRIGNAQMSVSKLASFVVQSNLTPSIFFCFSIARCEKYARALLNLDLTTEQEKKQIQEVLTPCLLLLGDKNQQLPQVKFVRMLLMRGIGVHYSSLMHVLREITEIWLSRNLVKILIATETFAMGVNMPTRSCVFLTVTKIDGDSFRPLLPGEFIQMSGRAGRRGKDELGTVILAPQERMRTSVVRGMLGKSMTPLKSRFRLSFETILCSFRAMMPVESLIRMSFLENAVQRGFVEIVQQIDKLNQRLLEIDKFRCENCSEIQTYFDDVRDICTNNFRLIAKSGILKIGTEMLMKNNSVIKIDEAKLNTIRNFQCISELDPSGDYLKYPIDFVDSEAPVEVFQMDQIFGIFPDFVYDYGIEEMNYCVTNNRLLQTMHRLRKEIQCKSFFEHYQQYRQIVMVRDELNRFKFMIDDKNLSAIDEYFTKYNFLVENGYLADKTITLKGKAASEIRTVDTILLSELVLNNDFKNYTGVEILCVFSATLFKEKIQNVKPTSTIYQVVEEKRSSLNTKFMKCGIEPIKELNVSAMTIMGKWLENGCLMGIALLGAQEGTFIRLLLRLDEFCREILEMCEVIGDTGLKFKIQVAYEKLKKSDLYLASLYV